MIGVITDKVEINRELLDVFEVEAHTWAVFPNEGHFHLQCKILWQAFMQNGYHLLGMN